MSCLSKKNGQKQLNWCNVCQITFNVVTMCTIFLLNHPTIYTNNEMADIHVAYRLI